MAPIRDRGELAKNTIGVATPDTRHHIFICEGIADAQGIRWALSRVRGARWRLHQCHSCDSYICFSVRNGGHEKAYRSLFRLVLSNRNWRPFPMQLVLRRANVSRLAGRGPSMTSTCSTASAMSGASIFNALARSVLQFTHSVPSREKKTCGCCQDNIVP